MSPELVTGLRYLDLWDICPVLCTQHPLFHFTELVFFFGMGRGFGGHTWRYFILSALYSRITLGRGWGTILGIPGIELGWLALCNFKQAPCPLYALSSPDLPGFSRAELGTSRDAVFHPLTSPISFPICLSLSQARNESFLQLV